MLDDASYLSQKDHHNLVGQLLDDLESANPELYRKHAASWAHDVAVKENLAKQVAQEAMGQTVVLVATPEVYEAALVWKQSSALVAHNVAFCEVVDTDPTQLIAAWSSHPVQKPFAIVVLTSTMATKPYADACDLVRKKLSGLWPEPIVIESSFDDPNAHLSALARTSSYYTAMLNQVSLAKK